MADDNQRRLEELRFLREKKALDEEVRKLALQFIRAEKEAQKERETAEREHQKLKESNWRSETSHNEQRLEYERIFAKKTKEEIALDKKAHDARVRNEKAWQALTDEGKRAEQERRDIASNLVESIQKKSIAQRKTSRSLAKEMVKITETEAGKLLLSKGIMDDKVSSEFNLLKVKAMGKKQELTKQLEIDAADEKSLIDTQKKIDQQDRVIDGLNAVGSIQKEILDDFGVGSLDFMDVDDIESQVLEVMGITKAQFDELGKAVEGSLDKTLFDSINEKVKILSDSTKVLSDENFKKLYDSVNNIETGFEGVIDKVDMFKGALTAPGVALKGLQLAATGLAISFAKDIVEGALSLRQELGVGVMESARLSANIKIGGLAAKVLGGDAEKVAEFAKEAANQFGTTSIFTKDIAEQVGILTAETGIGGAEAAKLAKAMGEVSGASLETNLQLIQTQGNLAKAQGLVPAKVLNDVANNTELFADFAKDGGDNIFGAARAASALGLELSTVAKTAEHLLDFESSIEKQMEAQLLTGKQLNLDKARMLTLDGDLEGLAEEIKNQVGSQAEFEAMNVFQRRALAEAFGVTTKDLAAMISGGATEAQIAEDRVKLQEKQAATMQEMMENQQIMLKAMQAAQTITAGVAALQAGMLIVEQARALAAGIRAKFTVAEAAGEAGASAAKVPIIGPALALAAIAAVGYAGYSLLRKPAPTGDLAFDAGTGAVKTSMTEGALVTLPNGQQFQGTPNDSVMMGPMNTESFGPLNTPIPSVQRDTIDKNQTILNKIYEENKKTNMESRKLREQNELLLIKLIKTTGNEGYSTREAIGSLGRNN